MRKIYHLQTTLTDMLMWLKTIAHMYLKRYISYFPYEYGNGSGHVAIIESATQNYFYSLDQNWYGGAQNNPPEVAQTIYHEYHKDMYFIEPLYGKETIVSKTKARMVKPKPIKNVKKEKRL